jgi:hypothetical protein
MNEGEVWKKSEKHEHREHERQRGWWSLKLKKKSAFSIGAIHFNDNANIVAIV